MAIRFVDNLVVRTDVKDKKFRVYKVVVPLALVGGIAVLISTNVTKNKKNEAEYEAEKYTNEPFEDIIENKGVSAIISEDEKTEYTKLKKMLEYKKVIDCKDLSGHSYRIVDYDDLTCEYVKQVIDNYYKEYENKGPTFDETCIELRSIEKAIDNFNKENGQKIVENMEKKLLAWMVINGDKEDELDDIKAVSNIELKYAKDGLAPGKKALKVKFNYIDENGLKTVKSDKFKNQDSLYIEELAKKGNYQDNLEKMYMLNAVANCDDYEIESHVIKSVKQ